MGDSNHRIIRTFDIAELALMIEAAKLQAATALCCGSPRSRAFFQKEAAELIAMAPVEMLWFDAYAFYEMVTRIREGKSFTASFNDSYWNESSGIKVSIDGGKTYSTEKRDFPRKGDAVERLTAFLEDYTPLERPAFSL